MPSRKKFQREELLEALQEIGENLGQKTTTYLIGGLNMILAGFKTTTKDVDLVFSDESSAIRFIRAAEEAGFYRAEELEDDYIRLQTRIVLDTPNGLRFDIFYHQVCGGLVLSPGMMERAKEAHRTENLHILSCSPEDMFLFKAITSRPDDLADMRALLGSEIEWSIVETEVRYQHEAWKWIGRLYGRLLDLEEEYNISLPLKKSIEREAEISQAIGLLIGKMENKKMTFEEIVQIIEDDRNFVKATIDQMLKYGLIDAKQDKYMLKQRHDKQ